MLHQCHVNKHPYDNTAEDQSLRPDPTTLGRFDRTVATVTCKAFITHVSLRPQAIQTRWQRRVETEPRYQPAHACPSGGREETHWFHCPAMTILQLQPSHQA